MAEAKERPILFSAPMVRALLGGTKTQTRRVCKNQPYSNGFHFDGHDILCHTDFLPPSAMLMDYREGGQDYITSNMEGWEGLCPYGQPGDRLWVKETFLAWRNTADNSFSHVAAFKADGYELEHGERWVPSIHMPRAASRILLEIVSVRVERLQDISEVDARAEGITDGGCTCCDNPEPCGCENPTPSAIDAYCHLWEQINGAGSWNVNPWVWVVEFRRIEPAAARAR